MRLFRFLFLIVLSVALCSQAIASTLMVDGSTSATLTPLPTPSPTDRPTTCPLDGAPARDLVPFPAPIEVEVGSTFDLTFTEGGCTSRCGTCLTVGFQTDPWDTTILEDIAPPGLNYRHSPTVRLRALRAGETDVTMVALPFSNAGNESKSATAHIIVREVATPTPTASPVATGTSETMTPVATPTVIPTSATLTPRPTATIRPTDLPTSTPLPTDPPPTPSATSSPSPTPMVTPTDPPTTTPLPTNSPSPTPQPTDGAPAPDCSTDVTAKSVRTGEYFTLSYICICPPNYSGRCDWMGYQVDWDADLLEEINRHEPGDIIQSTRLDFRALKAGVTTVRFYAWSMNPGFGNVVATTRVTIEGPTVPPRQAVVQASLLSGDPSQADSTFVVRVAIASNDTGLLPILANFRVNYPAEKLEFVSVSPGDLGEVLVDDERPNTEPGLPSHYRDLLGDLSYTNTDFTPVIYDLAFRTRIAARFVEYEIVLGDDPYRTDSLVARGITPIPHAFANLGDHGTPTPTATLTASPTVQPTRSPMPSPEPTYCGPDDGSPSVWSSDPEEVTIGVGGKFSIEYSRTCAPDICGCAPFDSGHLFWDSAFLEETEGLWLGGEVRADTRRTFRALRAGESYLTFNPAYVNPVPSVHTRVTVTTATITPEPPTEVVVSTSLLSGDPSQADSDFTVRVAVTSNYTGLIPFAASFRVHYPAEKMQFVSVAPGELGDVTASPETTTTLAGLPSHYRNVSSRGNNTSSTPVVFDLAFRTKAAERFVEYGIVVGDDPDAWRPLEAMSSEDLPHFFVNLGDHGTPTLTPTVSPTPTDVPPTPTLTPVSPTPSPCPMDGAPAPDCSPTSGTIRVRAGEVFTASADCGCEPNYCGRCDWWGDYHIIWDTDLFESPSGTNSGFDSQDPAVSLRAIKAGTGHVYIWANSMNPSGRGATIQVIVAATTPTISPTPLEPTISPTISPTPSPTPRPAVVQTSLLAGNPAEDNSYFVIRVAVTENWTGLMPMAASFRVYYPAEKLEFLSVSQGELGSALSGPETTTTISGFSSHYRNLATFSNFGNSNSTPVVFDVGFRTKPGQWYGFVENEIKVADDSRAISPLIDRNLRGIPHVFQNIDIQCWPGHSAGYLICRPQPESTSLAVGELVTIHYDCELDRESRCPLVGSFLLRYDLTMLEEIGDARGSEDRTFRALRAGNTEVILIWDSAEWSTWASTRVSISEPVTPTPQPTATTPTPTDTPTTATVTPQPTVQPTPTDRPTSCPIDMAPAAPLLDIEEPIVVEVGQEFEFTFAEGECVSWCTTCATFGYYTLWDHGMLEGLQFPDSTYSLPTFRFRALAAGETIVNCGAKAFLGTYPIRVATARVVVREAATPTAVPTTSTPTPCPVDGAPAPDCEPTSGTISVRVGEEFTASAVCDCLPNPCGRCDWWGNYWIGWDNDMFESVTGASPGNFSAAPQITLKALRAGTGHVYITPNAMTAYGAAGTGATFEVIVSDPTPTRSPSPTPEPSLSPTDIPATSTLTPTLTITPEPSPTVCPTDCWDTPNPTPPPSPSATPLPVTPTATFPPSPTYPEPTYPSPTWYPEPTPVPPAADCHETTPVLVVREGDVFELPYECECRHSDCNAYSMYWDEDYLERVSDDIFRALRPGITHPTVIPWGYMEVGEIASMTIEILPAAATASPTPTPTLTNTPEPSPTVCPTDCWETPNPSPTPVATPTPTARPEDLPLISAIVGKSEASADLDRNGDGVLDAADLN